MSNNKDSGNDDFSLKSFMDGFNQEYNKEIKDKDKPLSEQAKEGIVTGIVETSFHPFRWLRSLLK
ncbi:MAG: hypothetical protein ABS46_14200 [Cytophagaceae bacterium SCN 52-12]|nr:MAG: hypothetical protein ABS46_14200 [Cytophagaceae bacterium SCN 52-12]